MSQSCAGTGFDLQRYQRRGAWQRAAGRPRASDWRTKLRTHYEQCADAFRELIGRIATAIISAFSAELDGLLAEFESFKRSAAVLDFDDLLYTTREVLRQNEPVRRAAAGRFQRILVDEFQDTDPIQAEIVFLLAAAAEHAAHWYERRLLPGRLFMVGDPKQAIYRFRGADIATYLQARDAVERQFPGNVVRVIFEFPVLRAPSSQHINRCFEAPLGAQETGYVALEATRGDAEHGLPCVAKIKVEVVPQSRIDGIRDDEASIVAETCARLIGNVTIRRAGAAPRLLAPGRHCLAGAHRQGAVAIRTGA